jgi:hypothetical protein
MLTGQAKTDYQRQYMRNRRARQAAAKAAKPKPAWEPTQALIDKIAYWIRLKHRQPWRLGALGREVLDGLDLTTEWTPEEWTEACHRLKAISAIRRQERQQTEAKPNAVPTPTCSFCGEPRSETRILVGSHGVRICEVCVMAAVEVIAAERGRQDAGLIGA